VDWLVRLPGKKSIVLLSTGVDSSQQIDWAALRSKLQTTDVKIFPVSLSAEIRRPVNPEKMSPVQKEARGKIVEDFAKADELLRNLAIATGGRSYFPQNQAEFTKTYQEISELLGHEYVLAFAPPLVDGKIHQLRVEAKRGGLKVDHRPAYLAATSGGPVN
jgi:VWFA-related protein